MINTNVGSYSDMVKKLSGIHLTVVRQFLGNRQAVVRWLSDSCLAIVRQSSGSQ